MKHLRAYYGSDIDQSTDDFQRYFRLLLYIKYLRKGTHLLEMYALEIQMATERKDNVTLKELYAQCLLVKVKSSLTLLML